MTFQSVSARRPQSLWAQAYSILLLLLLTVFLPQIADFFRWGFLAITSPTGIEYGEGIVWQQFLMIMSGSGYGKVEGIPAVVFHYPPVYYFITALIEPMCRDGLQAGRLVSFGATVGTACWIAMTTARLTKPTDQPLVRWLCILLSAVMFLHYDNVTFWAPLMRVDPVAIFFTMGGLYFGIVSLRSGRAIYLAAVFFTLAVFSKQTAIFAPAAVFGVLLFVRPHLAIRGIATAAIFSLAFLAIMYVSTDGLFLKHIISYNVNRFFWGKLLWNILYFRFLDLPSLLFAGGLTLYFVSLLAQKKQWLPEVREKSAELAILFAFIGLMTASLIMLGKSGAAENYWITWLAPVSILIGLGLFECYAILRRRSDENVANNFCAALLLIPVILIVSQLLTRPVQLPNLVKEEAAEQKTMAIVRECDGMVIGDDMVAILRAGKPVVWEPAIFTDLQIMGVYDVRPVVQAVEDGRVCAAVFERAAMDWRQDSQVLAAIKGHFGRRDISGQWIVFH